MNENNFNYLLIQYAYKEGEEMHRFKNGVLLFNGQAGQASSEIALSQIVPTLAIQCKELKIVQSMSPEEFQQGCMDASDSEVLFLLGGDGTLHTAIQVLEKLDGMPVIGILPGGTCNDFARTLNIPLTLKEAAISVSSGKISEIDVAKINDNWFMNFAGVGLITDASENINPDLKNKYGKLSYYMSAIQSFKESEPISMTIEVDGTVYKENAVMALVMNGNSVGTHRFPIDSIIPTDGLLDVILIQSSTIIAIREWFSLNQPNVIPEQLSNVIHYSGKHIVIRTNKPKKVDTDGEIYLETPVTIDVHPKKVRFLVPN